MATEATGIFLEALVSPASDIRVSGIVAEAVSSNVSSIKAGGIFVEVMSAPTPPGTYTSGIFVEVLSAPEPIIPGAPLPPLDSILLLPDPKLVGHGKAKIHSFSSAHAMYPGIGVPDASNEGSAVIEQRGVPITAQALDYRFVASGSLWREAQWAYKLEEEDDTLPTPTTAMAYRGANDLRYSHAPNGVVGRGPGPPVGGQGFDAANVCALYLPRLNREIMYAVQPSGGKVQAWYRDNVDRHTVSETDWNEFQLVEEHGHQIQLPRKVSFNQNNVIGAVNLRDGGALFFVADDTGTDVRVFIGEDGLNWTERADRILARFGKFGRAFLGFRDFKVSRSGDWIRFAFPWVDVDDDFGGGAAEIYMRTLVSNDRGASWTEISTPGNPIQPADTAGDPYPNRYDVGGVDDDAGTFIMPVRTSGTKYEIYIASGDRDWVHHSALDLTVGAGSGQGVVCCARVAEYFVILHEVDTFAIGKDLAMSLVDPRDVTNPDSWRRQLYVTYSRGGMLYQPMRPHLLDVGRNYFVLWSGAFDPEFPQVVSESPIYLRFGGWDPLPIEERYHGEWGDAPDYLHQPAGAGNDGDAYRVSLIEWTAWMGVPAPVGGTEVPAATPWVNGAGSAGVTVTRTPWGMNLLDTGGGSRRRTFLYNDTVLDHPWGIVNDAVANNKAGCCLEIIVKPLTGGSTTQDDIAARVISHDPVAGATDQIDVSLRVTAAGDIVVYDNVAAATLLSVSGLPLSTKWHKIRMPIFPTPDLASTDPGGSAPIVVALWYREEDAASDAWTYVGDSELTIDLAAGALQQLHFGHMTLIASARESEWRRCMLLGPHEAGQTHLVPDLWVHATGIEDHAIDNLRGRLMTNDEVYITDGIYATLGGAGAFEADLYHGNVERTYHPSNVVSVGSPRVEWRGIVPPDGSSGPGTGARSDFIIFDADPDNGVDKFYHQYVAAFGTVDRSLTIEYDDDVAFGAPSLTFALNMTRFSVGVTSVAGDTLIVPTTGLAARATIGSEPNDGAQYFLRITASPSDATKVGRTWRVESLYDSNAAAVVTLETDEDLATHILLDATVTIFSDRAMKEISTPVAARYMRVTFPTEQTAHDGQHRLGTLLAGFLYNPAVPLDWTHTDAESGNNSIHNTRGLVRWAYPEGPAQRVLESRLVGDARKVREELRHLFRSLPSHDKLWMGLMMDSNAESDPERLILGRIRSGGQMQNVGWRPGTDDVYFPVGDMKLKFEEEV